ncbi:MAG: dihydroorotate dehydrogenase electron transfer subunit [bacterium]
MNPVPAEIKENRQEAPGIFRLVLELKQETTEARPGQFFMIRTAKGRDPLLRRPLGLLKTEPGHQGLDLCFLYQVIGKGTRLLSRTLPGDETDLIGPLGTGWKLDESPSRIIAVAGGMGIVPLYAALAEVSGCEENIKTELVFGAATADEIVLLKELEAVAGRLTICTEDGCLGEKGLAPDLFKKVLAKADSEKSLVLACGPRPMLRKVRDICLKEGVACQVSMEARMGCGMGACLTCTVPGSAGTNLRVCKEGPVFDAREIDWEALDGSA